MIVTDKHENEKIYGLIFLGDTFIYYDKEQHWTHYCLQTTSGAVDLMTGRFVDISPYEEIELIKTELIVKR